MPQSVPVERYSSVVELELVYAGRTYRLTHVASTFLIFAKPTTLPPGAADPYIRVEGQPLHRRLHLPHGASPETPRVEIERL